MDKRYEAFLETKQEKRKLELALKGYFSGEEITETEREAYDAYLKKRIRPAVSVLLERGECDRIIALQEKNFFGRKELDDFLEMAQEKGQYSSWIRLLKMKNEKYGFEAEDE